MAVAFGAHPARADTNPLTDLVDAAAQRLQIADPVAAVKWQTQTPIEDPTRVSQQLAALVAGAPADQIDADYVRRIFTDQIAATEAVQYQRFADWKLDPSSAPSAAPALAASRTEIDRLNHVMLAQLGRQAGPLHSPACPGQLHEASMDVAAAHHLDGIYQRALLFATRSYCAS